MEELKDNYLKKGGEKKTKKKKGSKTLDNDKSCKNKNTEFSGSQTINILKVKKKNPLFLF